MQECPYCDSDLQGSTKVTIERGDSGPGQKSVGSELVACPDCDEVIDGFSAH